MCNRFLPQICLAIGLLAAFFSYASAFPQKAVVEGKYELSSDPSDPAYTDYLKELGVHESIRKAMAKLSINLEIQKTGDDQYKYRAITPILTKELDITLGETIDDKFVDGRRYKTTFVKADPSSDKITQKIQFDQAEGVSEYQFSEGGITVTQKAGDKVAIRKFTRVNEFKPMKKRSPPKSQDA